MSANFTLADCPPCLVPTAGKLFGVLAAYTFSLAGAAIVIVLLCGGFCCLCEGITGWYCPKCAKKTCHCCENFCGMIADCCNKCCIASENCGDNCCGICCEFESEKEKKKKEIEEQEKAARIAKERLEPPEVKIHAPSSIPGAINT